MPFSLKFCPLACLLGILAIVSLPYFTVAARVPVPPPPTAVLTQHNDNARTGDNLSETTLTIKNVNTNTFGLLYSRPVDDQIYAQPLIMTNVNIPGVGVRNLLIIATVNDTVYAYDADDSTVVAPYWTNSFLQSSNIVPVNVVDQNAIGACGGNYQDYSGNYGIVGTPVIDPVSGTIYLVARTKEIFDGQTNFVQRLHALDPTTGLDLPNSPVTITASYPGTGYGSTSGVLTFDPLTHNQRAALLLLKGIVYISWASHCDHEMYHGWVIGYNATTLQQAVVWVNTPNGVDGGIWMSGQGPSADTNGNIYLSSGNGSADATDFGESFVKLTNDNSGTLHALTSFTPTNFVTLDQEDADLGSAGLLLIPGTHLAVSGDKAGVLYLVNRDNMGGFTSGDDPTPLIVQSWNFGQRIIHGAPVWWKSTGGSFMYIWAASQDHLWQYRFNGKRFRPVPVSQSANVGGSGSPGGILSISAHGTKGSTGIVWAVINSASANHSLVPGTLHAYDARKVSRELWNSGMLPGDALGTLAKFVPPTIANGKVYMATFDGRVQVYGLR